MKGYISKKPGDTCGWRVVASLLGMSPIAPAEVGYPNEQPSAWTQADIDYEATLEAQAENLIDQKTNYPYLVPAQTRERHDLHGSVLRLRYAPVGSVTTVVLRSGQIGDIERALVANSDFELFDPHIGELHVGTSTWPGVSGTVFVDYAPNIPCPDNISRAAAFLVAWMMLPHFRPERLGVLAVQLTSESQLKYDPDLMKEIPGAILDLIDFRNPIL